MGPAMASSFCKAKYNCGLCGQGAQTWEGYKLHMKLAHGIEL